MCHVHATVIDEALKLHLVNGLGIIEEGDVTLDSDDLEDLQ